jgi:cbb3-type cytochrome oxidase subunit 3
METDDDQEFNAAAYLAIVEDDEAEDTIWEKYIK